jgi:alkylation response protein AidB-like acyl-CoA dehydrogenase
MNFDFSDDQKQLKGEARKFLEKESAIPRVRAVLNDDKKNFDEALWKAVGAQGWLGAAVPEEYGGLGLGHLELCCIAEELGRALAPIPFGSTVYFFTEALLIAGSDAQKKKYLPKVAAGEIIGAFATSEAPGPVTAASISSKVEAGKLTGVKLPVTDGDIATAAIVLANEGGKPALFIVDLANSALTRETLKTMDPTRSVARITFSGAPAERLGNSGEGLDLMERVFDRAAVLIAFEQIGGSDKCLEMAKDYALGRYAFGRQIGSYQAIKHKLADMYIKNELARSNAYYGAWALHMGSRLPPLFPPLAPAGACRGRAARMERAPRLPARAAQRRLSLSKGRSGRWISTTRRKKPPIAPRCAHGSSRTRPRAPPAPVSAMNAPLSLPDRRPGRNTRPQPATRKLRGRGNGAAEAAPLYKA